MRRYLRQGFLVIAVLFLLSQSAFAVLPPGHHNIRDLNVMVKFIEKHPNSNIAYNLKSIDFENYTIHFGNGCKAIFGSSLPSPEREPVPGPGYPIEFKGFDCDEHEGKSCMVDGWLK